MLLDAVGHTVVTVGNRLANTAEHRKPEKVVVVITTEGMENGSREYTHEKVRELIEQQREEYNWDFIFMWGKYRCFERSSKYWDN
ncbi:hypothetical protein Q9251_14855 [Alkalihalobacillus macyae]|uniref:hypothetical protein n=1 Tax=Guptibacillus hwajinpoensis TaxID=208199 RepID=UPI00273CEC52|nr:hypothetical protein [Alkalihalobacillus macyae]MDP4552154.1 hypothetical protein [Alkalihalobacillus macyae]